MPVSDIDIWRSANELIKQHGDRAWTEAVLKYFEMKRAKDVEGIAVWRRIARAISFFTSPLPRARATRGEADNLAGHEAPEEPDYLLN